MWPTGLQVPCRVLLFMISWTGARQAPLSMEFSRQQFWSGKPFPSPGDLSYPGIKPTSPSLAEVFFPTSATWLAHQFSSVQSLSRVWLFATLWIAACQVSQSITNSRSSPMSIQSVILSNHLILCHLLLLLPITLSIRVFSRESTLRMRWPNYWSFSFSISPFNEHLRLVSFRMDWLDLLTVQGTLKSLLQHHSSKASIHQHSAFFTVNNHQFNIQEL